MFTLYRLLSQDLQNQNNPEHNAEEEPPWYQQISFYRQVLKTHKNFTLVNLVMIRQNRVHLRLELQFYYST